MVISVRLDEGERRLVGQLSRTLKKTQSEVIRAGLEALAEREHLVGKPTTAYERIEHLIGCVKGPADLSERTGEGFRRLLAKKAAKK